MNAIAPLKQAVKSTISAVSRWGVPCIEPMIVRTLPHDRMAFTQGLAYLNGVLYESSGDRRRSFLRCMNASDGQIMKTVAIPDDFAEGIAIHQNQLYQLTWKSEKARVFRLPDLELVDELPYRGQGWGLASDHAGMVMSDGTGRLTFRDAAFRPYRTLRVTQNHVPTRRLNDLECVESSIYANVLFRSEVLEISAISGRVTRIIDCSALKEAVNPTNVEHVLNGICHNSDSDTFFITGKRWNLMFEVRIPPLDGPRD